MYEDDEDTPSFVELNTGKRLKYDILDSNKVGFIAYWTRTRWELLRSGV